MRLSGWVEIAPRPEAVTPKVLAVVEPMLTMLGCDPDPACWVVWGDDPGARYTILAATDAGLAQVNARVMVPGEGPRASGKLVRWARAQVGDLAVEMQGGHRILSYTIEGQILRGTDDTADAVAAFALDIFAAIDGRPRPSAGSGTPTATGRGASRTTGGGSSKGKGVLQLDAPKEGSS